MDWKTAELLYIALVYTKHKSLEYPQAAKKLNIRQARWVLFFTRFHFTIADQPELKNLKANALSRQYLDQDHKTTPTTILASKCFVNAITWAFDEDLRNTSPDVMLKGNPA